VGLSATAWQISAERVNESGGALGFVCPVVIPRWVVFYNDHPLSVWEHIHRGLSRHRVSP